MSLSPAAGHALDILRLLARHPEPVPAAAICRELRLPRSTTYRLLATLADRGFVTHLAETNRYGMGLAAYELGSAYQRQAPLQRVARPALAKLVDVTTHSAHLAVLSGRDVLYVIEERARGRPALLTDVGVRLPAEVTASGLAMLAHLPTAAVSALYPHPDVLVRRHGSIDRRPGPRTVSDLRRLLTDVRARGYAVEEESVTAGLSSVGVAVLDHTGHPVAAVACTFPTDEPTPARDRLVAQVRATVAGICARIGA